MLRCFMDVLWVLSCFYGCSHKMEEMNPVPPEPGWNQEIFSSNILPFHFTSPLRNEAISVNMDVMVISDWSPPI